MALAAASDLVIVPGFADIGVALSVVGDSSTTEVVKMLRGAHAAGAQLASMCTGAFLLASSGLLDGATATTHWRYRDLLQERYPQVKVDTSVLYTHDSRRRVWTSGVTAGVDLCLAILADRYGAATAATVARSMVLPAIRYGGQAQYVPARTRPHEATGSKMEELRRLVRSNLARSWTLAELADASQHSPRSLQRRFAAEAGMTPSQWVVQERILAARELLEDSHLTVEQIARRIGFGSANLLRKHFATNLTVAPSRYREAICGDGSEPGPRGIMTPLTG